MSNQSISDATNLYTAINGSGSFIPKKKETVVGISGALMMQVNLINIIGEVTGLLADLMKDLAAKIEELNKQKVDELNALNNAMAHITKDGDNSPSAEDLIKDWSTAHGDEPPHPDWIKYAGECGNQSLNQLMNTYNTRSTSWDTQIKPLQTQIDAMQSTISNHSQNQASFLQQMQPLENLFSPIN